jgi:hypothetical protein
MICHMLAILKKIFSLRLVAVIPLALDYDTQTHGPAGLGKN